MKTEQIFTELESNVRSYCRSFPVVFNKACNHLLYDEKNNEYIDFFSGAGALNYGHNNPILKKSIMDYLDQNGIIHSLDFYTEAKRNFLKKFDEIILKPKKLKYKIQFTGPTGTNAVEAALKLARKVTNRTQVIAFTNGFHGMTLGALSATSNSAHRAGSGIQLTGVTHMPYDGYLGDNIDTITILEKMLDDKSSGLDTPAAFLLETIQAEGGINIASANWLKRLSALAKRKGILIIVDDIQVGCGRTGSFFSFEFSGIYPDIVCLSKSIGGYGLPLALVLIRPEHDTWKPGEHNGTFRGNNLAFIAGATALDYWKDKQFHEDIERRGLIIRHGLEKWRNDYPAHKTEVRGKGMIQGIEWKDRSIASLVSEEAFKNGIIAETCGAYSQVLKLMPPLTINDKDLARGLDIIDSSINTVYKKTLNAVA